MSDEGGSWYPGKRIRERIRARRAGDSAADAEPAPPQDAEETKDSDKWYPGKKVKERLAKRRHRLRQARAEAAERVGSVVVSGLQAARCAKAHPFVVVAVEGAEQATPAGDHGEGVWPDAALEFEVGDVTGDVTFTVMNSGPVRDLPIGRACVPLVSLLDAPSRRRDVWLELLPAGKTSSGEHEVCAKFEAAAPGLPGTGMKRPAAPLGFVRASVELRLAVSPYLAYLASPPQAPPHFVDKEFDPTHLKTNVGRIKAAAGLPVVLAAVVALPPPIFAAAVAVYCFFAYHVQAHHLPLLGALWLIGNGLAARGFVWTPAITIWDDDIERDPDLPKTPLGKVKRLKGLLFGLQTLTGALATAAELVPTLYNWTDARVSLLACAVTAALAAASSLVLYVFPLRLLLAAPGLALLVGLHRRHMRRRGAPAAVVDINADGEEISDTLPASAEDGDSDQGQGQGQGRPEDAPAPAAGAVGPATRLQQLKNLVLRTPTYHELVHRSICESAVREGSSTADVKFAVSSS